VYNLLTQPHPSHSELTKNDNFPLKRYRKHHHNWYRCSKMLNSVSRFVLALPARHTSKTQNTLGRLRDKVSSGTSPIAARAQEGPKQAEGFCVFCLLQFSMNYSRRIVPLIWPLMRGVCWLRKLFSRSNFRWKNKAILDCMRNCYFRLKNLVKLSRVNDF